MVASPLSTGVLLLAGSSRWSNHRLRWLFNLLRNGAVRGGHVAAKTPPLLRLSRNAFIRDGFSRAAIDLARPPLSVLAGPDPAEPLWLAISIPGDYYKVEVVDLEARLCPQRSAQLP